MWIKSQFGNITIDVCGYGWSWEFDYFDERTKVYNIFGYPVNDGQAEIKIGSYSTESKARKVIQMLDKHLEKRVIKQATIPPEDGVERIAVENRSVIWEILSCLPNNSIFRMPQDNEVTDDEE